MLEWVSDVVHAVGLPGVALLMLVENIVPPLPSELIMPFAGYVTRNDMRGFWLAVLAGTIGSVGGAVFWFIVGREVGEHRVREWFDRHGRWLGLRARHIDRAQRWFVRHDAGAVLIGRLIPGVRVFVSLPAGFARMPWIPFLLYSTMGTLVWVLALTYAGRLLGIHFARVHDALTLMLWLVLATSAVALTMLMGHRHRLPPPRQRRRVGPPNRRANRPGGRRATDAAR